jgi:asparagine synthase (glutamine-hydrolysing)
MPGIGGIISRRSIRECEDKLHSMLTMMQHEPFYRSGLFSVPELGVCAGWVAHENSFAANQVFFNEQRSIAILFSGECFSDPAISSDLRQKGHEVENKNGAWLPHLYEEKGSQFWETLNGMFSGLLIDRRDGKVFLFNDRYGTERIYWHEAADAFYFASEAKALLRVLPALRQFDQDGVAQLLTFGCTLNWRTLFRGIQILPGGSLWTFQDRSCRRDRYFKSQTWESLPALPPEAFQSKLDDTFTRILPRYFQTDSSLGVALTGGLDTRMILACKPENIPAPISYTFTGRTGETFDDRVAAEVARACGLEHYLLRLDTDFLSDFPSHADRTVYITDGCFGITGAHEIYFNKQARQLAAVRLTGLFGSEILRGVSTFKPATPPASLLNPEFRDVVAASIREFTAEHIHPVASAAFRNIPWNLFGSMAANRSQLVLRSPYLDNEIVALAFQSPPVFRKSPSVALRLIQHHNSLLAGIPTDRRVEDKHAGFPRNLRRLPREIGFKLDYYYNEGMPNWGSRFDGLVEAVNAQVRIFGHHKFLHYRRWFRKELAPYVVRVLTDARTQQSPFWKGGSLDYIARAHTQGLANYVLAINAILTLEAVERLLLRDLPNTLEDLSDCRIPIATLTEGR